MRGDEARGGGMTGRVVISELGDIEETKQLEALFSEIWQTPAEPLINADLLRALSHSGNYVVGARVGDRLVGGLVGWLGGSPPHDLHLHSHVLGVVGNSGAHGIGFELKQHQRRWCLERGVKVIEWTTDPLVRRNAYFNLHKLGAQASRYLVNFYGVMTDGLNAGEESDRLLISWQLDSEQAASAAAGRVVEQDMQELIRGGAPALLTVGPAGEPVAGSSSGRLVVCQVPEDIVALRRADPAMARAWRLAVRRALTEAFDSGFRINDVTRGGWYVLKS
ncbi:MAG TPA: GNAT family N-acetyltransferase [Clostridia bacterium]|nr:GNAT family N-acetyltransferase [Clostridia bacterium]